MICIEQKKRNAMNNLNDDMGVDCDIKISFSRQNNRFILKLF